jgi:hypothetical protein
MKKIMLSVAFLAAVVMTSCGETACSCKEKMIAMATEAMSSATDMDKEKGFRAEAADLEAKCKGFTLEQYAKCK